MFVVDDASFPETFKAVDKMIVMFGASFAGPCNIVKPVFENLEAEYEDIVFAYCDLEKSIDTPQSYGVRSIPCFVTFVNQVPHSMKAGALREEILREMLDDCGKV